MSERIVAIETDSPGDAKSGCKGMRVEWGIAVSPFGLCGVGWSYRGICNLAFCDRDSGLPDEWRGAWPGVAFRRNDRMAEKWIRKIFAKKPPGRIPVFVRGTAFQVKVWRALLRIPRGAVSSYSKIAGEIGHPRACRAVGAACGANRVAWLIPCHRVIHASGTMNGYRWGAERKRSMLAVEGAVFRV